MINAIKSGGLSPARVATEAVINRILKTKTQKHSILDIGSKNNVQRDLLANSKYITCDLINNKEIDVVCDAHNLPFDPESFDLVMCQEVLEHLENPQLAINEMYRVLKFGGEVVLSTRFIFPLHADPYDFYRFTDDGLKKLFHQFKKVSVYPAGGLLVSISMLIIHSLPELLRKHRLVAWIGKIPVRDGTRFACGYVVDATK